MLKAMLMASPHAYDCTMRHRSGQLLHFASFDAISKYSAVHADAASCAMKLTKLTRDGIKQVM